MNDVRFDTWTRRRVGQAAGSLLALLALPGSSDNAAGKKHSGRRKHRHQRQRKRNRRCLTPRQRCRNGKGKGRCCAGLTCDETITLGGLARRCCWQPQNLCEGVADCCYPASCDAVAGTTDRRCCREIQHSCIADDQCCRDLRCEHVSSFTENRCCAGEGAFCQEDDDCCANDVSFRNLSSSQCERVS